MISMQSKPNSPLLGFPLIRVYLFGITLIYIGAYVTYHEYHRNLGQLPLDDGIRSLGLPLRILAQAVQGLIMLIFPFAFSGVVAIVVNEKVKHKDKTLAGLVLAITYTVMMILMSTRLDK